MTHKHKQASMHREKTTSGRCYESHKPLPIGEHIIHGGSCSNPMVTNADVYVGFDYSMNHKGHDVPWDPVVSFQFLIQDMGVPNDPAQFKLLIEWLAVQLAANKIVHLGCIGGHGRTGMVMAALVTHMTGELDSITYVRKHYCEKAVESAAQVKFLNQHFGITEVKGAKDFGTQGSKGWYEGQGYPTAKDPHMKGKKTPSGASKGHYVAQFVKSPVSVWGESQNISFDKFSKPATI